MTDELLSPSKINDAWRLAAAAEADPNILYDRKSYGRMFPGRRLDDIEPEVLDLARRIFRKTTNASDENSDTDPQTQRSK
jgi:hypothetical protein